MRLTNRYNSGGIRATLKRWYADESKQNMWVCFDGVSLSLASSLDSVRARSLCLVKELGGVIGDDPVQELHEFLYSDI